MLKFESIVVRIHQSRRHRRPTTFVAFQQRHSHHRSMHACLVVFASYRTVVQELKLVCCESLGKSSCWSVDSFSSSVARHSTSASTFDIRQVQIAELSSCCDHEHVNPHVPFRIGCNVLQVNATRKNPFFMRWVFQIRPVVRSSTRAGVGVVVGS